MTRKRKRRVIDAAFFIDGVIEKGAYQRPPQVPQPEYE